MSESPSSGTPAEDEGKLLRAFEEEFDWDEKVGMALGGIVMRYRELYGANGYAALPTTSNSELRLAHLRPLGLELQAVSSEALIRSVQIGHWDIGIGGHVFYPELVALSDVITIKAGAKRAFKAERMLAMDAYLTGGAAHYVDYSSPIVRGLTWRQHQVLTGSGLAGSIIEQYGQSRRTSFAADEATSLNLRFFSKTSGASGSATHLNFPEGRLLVEMRGLVDQKTRWRHDENITIGELQGFDLPEGHIRYAPVEKLITQEEYDRYILPLLWEIRAAQALEPHVSFSKGPGLVYHRGE